MSLSSRRSKASKGSIKSLGKMSISTKIQTDRNNYSSLNDFPDYLKKKEDERLESILNKINKKKVPFENKLGSCFEIDFSNSNKQINKSTQDNPKEQNPILNKGFAFKSKMYYQRKELTIQRLQSKSRQDYINKFMKYNTNLTNRTNQLCEHQNERNTINNVLIKPNSNRKESLTTNARDKYSNNCNERNKNNNRMTLSTINKSKISKLNSTTDNTRLQLWIASTYNWKKNVDKKIQQKKVNKENQLLTYEKGYFVPTINTTNTAKPRGNIQRTNSVKFDNHSYNYKNVIRLCITKIQRKQSQSFTPKLYRPNKHGRNSCWQTSKTMADSSKRNNNKIKKTQNETRKQHINNNKSSQSNNRKDKWQNVIKNINKGKGLDYSPYKDLYGINVRNSSACEIEQSSILFSNSCSFISL